MVLHRCASYLSGLGHESTSDEQLANEFAAELRPSSAFERQWLLGSTIAAVTGDGSQRLRLDRYTLLSQLGRGGQGVVWEADDPKLCRRVAIKVLDSDHAEFDERIRHEARAMARLAHTHVASVFDFGLERGKPYVVMELVDGVTLDQWLERGQPTATILRTLIDAGRGIAAAHDAGLAHGDFKPSNVMVSDEGVAKVLDFGLARVVRDDPYLRGGSLPYMAPEIRKTGVPTQMGDQYAFCMTLCEALLEGTAPDVRPSDLDGRHPAWFKRALTRGLSPQPAARWPSMRALLRALHKPPRWGPSVAVAMIAIGGAGLYMSTEDTSTCATGEARAEQIWSRQRRDDLAKKFSTATRAQTDSAFGVRTFARVETLLDGYLARWIEAYPQTCDATVRPTRDCLDRAHNRLDALLDTWGDSIDHAGVQGAVIAITQLPKPEDCTSQDTLPILEDPATTLLDRAFALRDAGRRAEASRLAARAVEETVDAAPAIRAEALILSGQLLNFADPPAGARRLEAAMHVAVAGGHDRLATEAGLKLAHAAASLHEYDWAQRAIRATDAAASRYGGDLRVDLGLDGARAEIAYNHGNYDAAVALLQSMFERAHGFDPSLRARVLHNLARARIATGTPEGVAQAIEELRDTLRVEIELYGGEHPTVSETRATLGLAWLATGDHDNAGHEMLLALESAERSADPDDTAIAVLLNNLSTIEVQQGEFEAAQSRLTRALEIRTRTLGPSHPDTGIVIENLGWLAEERGDFEKATRFRREAMVIYETGLGHEHPWVAESEHAVGLAFLKWGKQLAAQDEREQAEHAYARAMLFGDEETVEEATQRLALL